MLNAFQKPGLIHTWPWHRHHLAHLHLRGSLYVQEVLLVLVLVLTKHLLVWSQEGLEGEAATIVLWLGLGACGKVVMKPRRWGGG